MSEIAVLGAGSWGTALALHASGLGHGVRLMFRTAKAARQAAQCRENRTYLPGMRLPEKVAITSDAGEALSGADLVLVVTPVKGLDLAVEWLARGHDARAPVVSCAKGITTDGLETPTALLARLRPECESRLAALSGPTFAVELARGHPTAAVVASRDLEVARHVQSMLAGGSLRLYTNLDLPGVELAGALKNVMALAAGVVDGLGYGANTSAALITRGLSEMTRLATAAGAASSTLSGLAGLGDLILTCTGALSRNREVGRQLGRGRSLAEVIEGMQMVAEGVSTTRAALCLAERYGVEMPIAEQMAAILFEEQRPADAVAALLARALKEEDRSGGASPSGLIGSAGRNARQGGQE